MKEDLRSKKVNLSGDEITDSRDGGIPVKEKLDLSDTTSENRAGTKERKLCGGRFLAQYCEEQPLAPGMGCLVR